MFMAAPGSAVEQAETRWLLARALRDADREAEARTMAEAAAASHRGMDGDWSERLVEIERFLDTAP